MRLTWQVPAIGAFTYTTRVGLREQGDDWLVHWAPTVVHPALKRGQRLGTTRTQQPRGKLLDREGYALIEDRPVKRVGVVAGEIDDPAATAQAIADVVDIDPRPFQRAIENGGRAQFVEAISLRPEDYAPLEAELVAIPGERTIDATAQLGPTRGFARALLGDVRELSADQLRRLGPQYAIGDVGGQWGLEAALERELAGTAARSIVVRAVDGTPTKTLKRVSGTRAQDVKTTLDADVQAAAEQALDSLDPASRAALVALQPSTGDVLAVGNRPLDDSFDRALDGQYPPGSTFKIVTTDALLEGRVVRTDTTVDCPTTIDVGGRSFKNFEGGGGGEEPFSSAFAQSCNTAFVGLADRLPSGALPEAGRRFGLGARFDLPVPAYGGQVPEPRDLAATAAAMIGQDRNLASPLGMAGVIATVADGSWRPPRLLADDGGRDPNDGTPLTPAITDQLRDLTREVITSGTGTALAGLSGEAHGKSGTAEYGTDDPPRTHAWFVAYRDDVAVAVLVEDGVAGGEIAAPVANDFFEALDAGLTPETLAANQAASSDDGSSIDG